MKVVFMGTPDFAVPALDSLIKNNYDVACVFTQPDKPKGRGQKLQQSPVKICAIKNEIKVYQPEKLRKDEKAFDLLKEINPDVIVVAAYGQILPQSIIDLPKYGCINIHASLLPELRGAAPINWAIINGLKKTGITIMQMDSGIDTGDILLQRSTEIKDNETAGELYQRLMIMGSELILDVLTRIEGGTIIRLKQNNEKHTYASMLNKELAHINWQNSNKNIYNLIRGLDPSLGAYSIYNDIPMKIWKSEIDNNNYDGIPGTIINVSKRGIIVKCKEGSLIINEIQINGSKRMEVQSYINGHSIENGIILG